MAPVVAVVAKVVTAIVAKITIGAVVKFVLTTALSIGVSKLLAKRAMKDASAGGDGGGRVQLPPATDNKIPVVYGSAFIGGSIIDAMISADQKTMRYVVALAEVTDTATNSAITYGDIYYDGKLIQFGTQGAVTALINNSTSPSQSDSRVNGYLYVYPYVNGSSNPDTSITTLTAQDVLSIAEGVPAGQAWGVNNTMTNCAFVIVKVKYSTDAGTTGLGAITAQIKNTEDGQDEGVFRPGSAIKDYMLNTRYGCAIPLASIDTDSLDDLNTYSDQMIDVIGGPEPDQARYTINGPLDTGQNCLTNLQFLVDSCDSWLQYSELTGKWKVVINKAYDQAPNVQSINDLFIVNSSNLIGGIEVSPIDLNETYNQVEVAYPNFNIKDQTDYQIIDLFETNPELLSQNEAVNRLNITLPLVNNAVQAKYLAARRIYQSREDLVVSFRVDYSGIQVEAGDVIRVYHETYGWDAANGFPDGKLFRVSEVIEEKDAEGNLFAAMRAFEYNATIYADDPVEDYIPAFNTGLKDPNIITVPGTPSIVTNPFTAGQVESFNVTSAVPESGTVLYMDFNYGNNSNVQQHQLYRSVQLSPGVPFTNSTDIANNVVNNVSISVNDLPAGNYYFSTTARNEFSGRQSATSNVYSWTGANLVTANSQYLCNVSSNGNLFTHPSSSNITVGATILKITGTGTLSGSGYTKVEEIISDTQFVSTLTPTVDLANACIQLIEGGLPGDTIQPDSVNWLDINPDANPLYRSVYVLNTPVFANGNGGINFANIKATYNPSAAGPFFLPETLVYPDAYIYPWAQGTASTANNYAANSTSSFTPRNAAILYDPPTSDSWYEAVRVTTTAVGETIGQFANLNITTQWTADGDSMVQILPYYKLENSNVHVANTFCMSTIIIPESTPVTWQYSQFYPRAGNTSVGSGDRVEYFGWYVRNLSATTVICIYNSNELMYGKQLNQFIAGGTY